MRQCTGLKHLNKKLLLNNQLISTKDMDYKNIEE